MMIGAWKIAPALAVGNSVVVKPPEIASLTLLRLAQLASEAGLPDDVLNVVTGRGAQAGAALALHMDVDAIAFTGSGAVPGLSWNDHFCDLQLRGPFAFWRHCHSFLAESRPNSADGPAHSGSEIAVCSELTREFSGERQEKARI